MFSRRHFPCFLVLLLTISFIACVSGFVPRLMPGSCSRCSKGAEVALGASNGWREEELAGAIGGVVRAEIELLENRLAQRLQGLREELQQDLQQALGQERGSRQRQEQQQEQEAQEQQQQQQQQLREVLRIEHGMEEPVKEKALRHITTVMDTWYATPLSARSIYDLTDLLTDGDFHMHGEMGVEPTTSGRLSLVRRVTSHLVEGDVPARLLRCIVSKLELAHQAAGGPALGLLTSDGRVDEEALNNFREQQQQPPEAGQEASVVEALMLLDGVVAAKEGDRAQALERSDGAGLMCLVAAAFPHLYLDTADATIESRRRLLLPPHELHCGLRFRGYLEGTAGLFKLGVVGWSEQMASAVQQLGQCLGALRWLLKTCLPPEKREKKLGFIGRYYLLRHDQEHHHDLLELEEQCREEARQTWDYGFGVMDLRSALGFQM